MENRNNRNRNAYEKKNTGIPKLIPRTQEQLVNNVDYRFSQPENQENDGESGVTDPPR